MLHRDSMQVWNEPKRTFYYRRKTRHTDRRRVSILVLLHNPHRPFWGAAACRPVRSTLIWQRVGVSRWSGWANQRWWHEAQQCWTVFTRAVQGRSQPDFRDHGITLQQRTSPVVTGPALHAETSCRVVVFFSRGKNSVQTPGCRHLDLSTSCPTHFVYQADASSSVSSEPDSKILL